MVEEEWAEELHLNSKFVFIERIKVYMDNYFIHILYMSFYSDLLGESNIDCNSVYSDVMVVNANLDLSNATIIGDVIPDADNTYNIGSLSKRWANIFANSSFNGPSINVDTINNYTPNSNITIESIGLGHVKVNDLLEVTDKIQTDEITANTLDGDLSLSGNRHGIVKVNDNLEVTGSGKILSLEINAISDQIVIQPNDAGTFFSIRHIGNPSANRYLTLPDLADGTFLIDNAPGLTQTINSSITINENLNLPNLQTTNNTCLVLDANDDQVKTLQYDENITASTIAKRNSAGELLAQTFVTNVPGFALYGKDPFSSYYMMFGLGIPTTGNRFVNVPDSGQPISYVVLDNMDQTITGTKNFTRIDCNQIIVKDDNVSDGLYFENSASYTTKIIAEATAANRIYRLPETGSSGLNYFVMTQGNQFITGQKEFTQNVYFNANTPAFVFGTSTSGFAKIYVNNSVPSADRTYTVVDAGANCNFMLTAGNQSMSGIQTITNTTNSTSTSTGALIVNGGAAINKSVYIGTTSATDGIYLNNNTASYTPSVLNYYESTTYSTTFNCRGGVSASITIKILRIGNQVTVTIPAVSLISVASVPANVMSSTTAMPARFRISAARQEVGYFTTFDGTAATNSSGPVHVLSTGIIEIYRNTTLSNWNTNTTCQLVYGASFSYII